MIKAVLFDVDGVLIDSFEANLKFFQRLISKAGYTPPTREEYQVAFSMNLRSAIKRSSNPRLKKKLNGFGK
jgi:beta-phosphoglucomutase-like phosphatase (HAD superfamily)